MGVPHYPITIFLMKIGNFVGNVHIFWLNQILYHVDYIPHPIVYVCVYIYTHPQSGVDPLNQSDNPILSHITILHGFNFHFSWLVPIPFQHMPNFGGK